MRTVYALFVGIDDYPGAPLRGCVNDVREAEDWLRRHGGPATDVRTLHDAQATRAAVVRAVEEHLGQGGPGDTALLWFSGHGSERPTDDPREATGMCQALVCHDSLDAGGRPLLQDTELGGLLDAIAGRGVHVVAVLDCCHAGGATRGTPAGATARGVEWRPWWRTSGHPEGAEARTDGAAAGADRSGGSGGTGGSRDGGAPDGPEPRRHVLLAACRPQERAHEAELDGRVRGYFSHALLHALHRLGPTAAYGPLHALAEERVRSLHPFQHPGLRGPHDRSFLHGDTVPGSPFLLRHTASGWEVDCGYAHGLRAADAEFTLLGEDGRRVAVTAVRPESALVEPVDWRPLPAERDRVHPVTPSALAFPPAAVTVLGPPGTVRMVSEALAGAPLLAEGGDGLPLRVEAGGDGWARVSGGDGHPLAPLPLRTPADAGRLADCLTHITRWHHIRDLANPDPWLSSLVRVTAEPLVGTVGRTATGETICAYTGDLREPQVRVRIHNDSPLELWCVLLDLTDSYGSSPSLYEGDFVGPGRAGLARHGEPVWLRLPPGRAVVRGASTRDWLKAIVAENELNTAPFRLPPWSAAAPGAARGATASAGGGLLRLAPPRGSRDAGGPAHAVGRWGTAMIGLRTVIP